MTNEEIGKTIAEIVAIDKWGISVGGAVSNCEISQMETMLGVKFCGEYRLFLMRGFNFEVHSAYAALAAIFFRISFSGVAKLSVFRGRAFN